MDWKTQWKDKLINAEQAAAMVKPGMTVVFTSGREALAIGLAIAARKEELRNVTIISPTPTFDFGWYDPGWQDSFKLEVRMPTGVCQDAVDARLCDINPGSWIPFMDVEAGDILLTEVSPPDEKGFCSFGNSLWAKKRQIHESKVVIAEVNEHLIRTFGDNFIHVSELDYLVEHKQGRAAPGSGSLAGRAKKEPEPYLKDIAKHASSLIRNGDTLQIGVGRSTEPLTSLGMLDGKADLGWHSEATPPGIISRIKSGLINGRCKTLNPNIAVITSIGGSSAEEMMWVHQNPLFHLVDVAYLEDVRVIAAHDNMVAINNALAIDLGGQVTAQSVGTREISAAGGQIAFVMGAWLSRGGRSITILPATALGGSASRIVPRLPEGTVLTLQRNCVDCVVTEYGVANLKNRTLRRRAEELINVAHPKFRDDLRREAKELYGPP